MYSSEMQLPTFPILNCTEQLERSQSQDPVPYRFIKKVWYDIYHLFVSYQLTRNSR